MTQGETALRPTHVAVVGGDAVVVTLSGDAPRTATWTWVRGEDSVTADASLERNRCTLQAPSADDDGDARPWVLLYAERDGATGVPWSSAAVYWRGGRRADAALVLAATESEAQGAWAERPVTARTLSVDTRQDGRFLQWRGDVTTVNAVDVASVSAVAMQRTHTDLYVLDVHRGLGRGAGYCAAIDWTLLPVESTHVVWDVFLLVTLTNGRVQRLPLPAFAGIRQLTQHLSTSHLRTDDRVIHIDPYWTFRARRLAVRTTPVSLETDMVISEALTHSRDRTLTREKRRPVWVIGETGVKGQDTGFHLFRYLIEERPDIDARFVLSADSPDRERVEAVGPTVIHGTPAHARAVLDADRILCSHHPDYLFPVRTAQFRAAVKAPTVFLQHGVLGTKNMANLYGWGNGDFRVDHFLVSSEGERDIVVRDLGYPKSMVSVTGLSRFDALLDPSVPQGRLLIVPTWREWIASDGEFRSSDFRAQWLALVNSPVLASVVREWGWEVCVTLHPNFRQYSSQFRDMGVTVIEQGEVPVQELLRGANALMTDYSSVGFDFALLGRPVFYFQFDRERFLGKAGSHLDLDRDLPGGVARDVAGVEKLLTSVLLEGDGQPRPEWREAAVAYFPAQDRESNSRIVAVVEGAQRRDREFRARTVQQRFARISRRIRRRR